jgi:peptide/nickel transport system permease protein
MGTDDAAGTAIDWTTERRRLPVTRRTVLFVGVVLLTGVTLWYSRNVAELPVLDAYDVHRTLRTRDWLFTMSVLAAVTYLVVPLVQHPERTRRYWRRLRRRPLGLAAFGYVVGFFVVGTLGPLFTEPYLLDFTAKSQPPVFTSVSTVVVEECNGRVVDGACHGTFADPLGTTRTGGSILTMVVEGAMVATHVAVISAVIIVPLATAVGSVAAYVGGWVDEVLMRAVEILQVVPAILVYFICVFVYGRSLMLLVVVFGLVSWGGIARIVRAEALRLREMEYVAASEAAGGSGFHVLRQHVARNVTSVVVPAVTLQIPTLIFTETALAFLDISDPQLPSWGRIIARGIPYVETRWWVAGVPLLVLVVTLLAFNVLGDALRDVLDPRLE